MTLPPVEAALELIKTASGLSLPNALADDTITYRYEVTNNGPVNIANIMLANVHGGAGSFGAATVVSGNPALVAPGDTVVSEADHMLLQEAIGAAALSNTATAERKDPYGNDVTDNDRLDQTLAAPGLTVGKVADVPTVSVPGDVTYTVKVENGGNMAFAEADVFVTFCDDSQMNELAPSSGKFFLPA